MCALEKITLHSAVATKLDDNAVKIYFYKT